MNVDYHAIRDCLEKVAIQEVFARYALSIDTGDAARFAAVFTQDALWKWETDDFKIHIKGSQELKELAQVVARTCPGAQHMTANHVITVRGETSHAVCELMVFLSRPEGIYTAMQGLYDVDLRKINGSWLISELRVKVLNPEICLQGKIGEYWAGIRDFLLAKVDSADTPGR